MIELSPDEARVIGVLIEKAQTTPDQYPLTLNAVINGANQKNNRNPVTSIDDNAALTALIALRNKGLVVQQDSPGQRTARYRHTFKEGAAVNTPEMVLLAELFLRGPQTLGELRGHASRMHAFDSLDMVRNTLDQLMGRPEPLVKQIPPSPGSRAERFVQLMCPDLHPIDDSTPVAAATGAPPPAVATLGSRVEQLEAEVAQLRAALSKIATELGIADPLSTSSSSEFPQP